MDDLNNPQSANAFNDSSSTTCDAGNPRETTFPPAERSSDNDDLHEDESFKTFVLGYN